MKNKILLFLMTLLFAVTKGNAQAHNLQPGWCKYAKKVKGQARDESASAVCQVCKKENEKEQIAKAAEDKRRNDVAVAKAKADKLKAENLRLEKLRLQKEEEKRIKDKEIADKIAHDKAIQKNKQIATSGAIKSNVKGNSTNIKVADIECFTDNTRKVYGFKIDKKETLVFPFENGNKSNISRIEGTNLFALSIWDSENIYFGRASYYYILDNAGKKISIKGVNKFNYLQINDESNTIFLFETISEEKTENDRNSDNRSIGKFHTSKESLMADYAANQGRGYYWATSLYINHDVRYTIDFKGNLLEKSTGYTLRR